MTDVIVKVNIIPTTNAITSRTVELISSLLPCGGLLRVEAGAVKERDKGEKMLVFAVVVVAMFMSGVK